MLVCYSRRAAAATKPTEPQRSLRRFCQFGFPAVVFTPPSVRGACVASNEGKINYPFSSLFAKTGGETN